MINIGRRTSRQDKTDGMDTLIVDLTLCMLGNFACPLLSPAEFFFSKSVFFFTNLFYKKPNGVSNSFDPYRHFVGLNLGLMLTHIEGLSG